MSGSSHAARSLAPGLNEGDDARTLISQQEDLQTTSRRPMGHVGSEGGASWQVWALTFFGGIGGFLFGYDTGVISGALPFLRDELLVPNIKAPERLRWVQGAVVSSALAAAAAGSAAGGKLSDVVGRRRALLAADVLFTAGAVLMGFACDVGMVIAGRLMVGIGIGIASVVVPVYIAEAAPPSHRASLVTVNVLMITCGQFCAYLADFGFTYTSATWRWMLGVAAVPAVLQAAGIVMLLPESPKWLMSHGKEREAWEALDTLLPPQQAAAAFMELTADAANEKTPAGGGATWQLLKSPVVRRELRLGLGLQVLQQVSGINTVMYYMPAILEMAGVHDKRTALLLALVPAGVNALGTMVGMLAIDRCGRRKLLLTSGLAVTAALIALAAAFRVLEASSPPVDIASGTCGAGSLRYCSECIAAGCGFCRRATATSAAAGSSCMQLSEAAACVAAGGSMFTAACPAPLLYTGLVVAAVLLYLAAFSPGLGPVPWAVNSEIYPVQVRGLANGFAATANWVSNAAVSQAFPVATALIGGSGTFAVIAAAALAGLGWAQWSLPETKGLSLEEIQELFKLDSTARRLRRSDPGTSEDVALVRRSDDT